MSTKSNQLRAALRAYLAARTYLDDDAIYAAHLERFRELCARYGRTRVMRSYARYRGALTILVRNGITYRRL